MTLAGLCRDLFLLAQIPVDGGNSGRDWEDRIARYLGSRAVRTDTLPGGHQVLGCTSLSGLGHQVDGTIACKNAIIISEWKAHEGTVPKNDLLRFKAVTDDYYQGMGSAVPVRDLFRVFGGRALVNDELRRYGAINGISVIDRHRWPAAFLGDAWIMFDILDIDGPSREERAHLHWLSRPLQKVMARRSDGSYLIPAPPTELQMQTALGVHDRWSDRLWEAVDAQPDRLDAMLSRVFEGRVAA